jgi:dolichyl-phosphate beta-glucosyltransferase
VTRRILRFGLVALVPTTVDAGLLAVLHLWVGLGVGVANVSAIVVASGLSYLLHRNLTFQRNPFVRWVRFPAAFAGVAVLAGACDTTVLLLVHGDRTGTVALLAAKAIAVAVAASVRLLLYRALLFDVARRTMQTRRPRPPAPGTLRASVVVPALDEAPRIAATVAALRQATEPLAGGGGVEIVVVDDGSTDGTADAALAAGADQVVVLPHNRGKGAAVRAGVLAARGRSVAFTDADLSYSPDQIRAAIELVETGWDAVVGSRRHPDASSDRPASTLRGVGSRAVNLRAGAVLLSRPHDTQCGLKAFRSDAARLVFGLGRIDGFAFDIEVFHLIERYELALTEMPVRLAHAERSTVRAVRDGARLVRDLWRIRHLASVGAYDSRPADDSEPLHPGGRLRRSQ